MVGVVCTLVDLRGNRHIRLHFPSGILYKESVDSSYLLIKAAGLKSPVIAVPRLFVCLITINDNFLILFQFLITNVLYNAKQIYHLYLPNEFYIRALDNCARVRVVLCIPQTKTEMHSRNKFQRYPTSYYIQSPPNYALIEVALTVTEFLESPCFSFVQMG